MSIIRKIFPPELNPAYNPIITVVDSTNKNEDGFLFVFDVYSGCSATYENKVGTFKLPANIDGYGVFDCHRAVESLVGADIYPTLTGFTTPSNSFDKIHIQIGEEFNFVWNFNDNFQAGALLTGTSYPGNVGFTSTTTNYYSVGDRVLIAQNTTGATNSQYDGVHTVLEQGSGYIVIDVGFGASTPEEAGTVVYSDQRKTLFTGLTATSCVYLTNSALSHESYRTYDYHDFNIDGVDQGRFLTNVVDNFPFHLTSRAYLNAFQTATTATTRMVIITDDGGMFKFSGSPSNFYSVGIGPYNLNNSTLSYGTQPVITSNTTRYSAYTENSSSARTSEMLVFNVYDNCSRFEQYQLAFMDRLGSIISFTFDLASIDTYTNQKKEFKKITGSYNPTTNTWGYNSYDRGRTIFNVDETKQIKVTSNWIKEDVAEYLREMFTSPEVYHIDSNGNWLPIIITDNNYIPGKQVTKKLINVELTFQYAQQDDIQRG